MLRRKSIFAILIFIGALFVIYPWYSSHVIMLARRATGVEIILINNNSVNAQNESVLHAFTQFIRAKLTVHKESTQSSVLETSKKSIDENDSAKKETAQIKEAIPVKLPVKAIPEYKFPNLTQKAQDAYYGKGCKKNIYRKRLQVVFHEWMRLAQRRNITYFICYGTLLGAVRNNDIIPYDSDIDVTIFKHDYHKLYPEESKRPVDLNDGSIHMLLQRHSPHPKEDIPRRDCQGNIVRRVVDDCSIVDPQGRLFNGIYVYLDIFVIEDLGDKLWDEYTDDFHERRTIFPIQPCKFLGVDTKCPNDPKTYLWAYYEKNYKKPHWVCRKGKWVKNMRSARARLL